MPWFPLLFFKYCKQLNSMQHCHFFEWLACAHPIYVPHFNPVTSWWTFDLILYFSYCKWGYRELHQMLVSFSLGKFQGEEWLSYTVGQFSDFWGIFILLSTKTCSCINSLQCIFCSISSARFFIFLVLPNMAGAGWILIMVFNPRFPIG